MCGRLAGMAAAGVLLLAQCFSPLYGQEQELTLVLRGTFTTEGQIYPAPTASDPFSRSLSYLVDDALGAGAELIYRVGGTNLAFGLAAEVLSGSSDRDLPVAGGRSIPVEDGFRAIPLEFTGYFIIPASGRYFRFIMGGGAGMYVGRRVYRLAGTEAPAVSTMPGYGIHAVAGVAYRLTEWFSVLAELKFRDIQFESTNQFNVSQIQYNGIAINLPGRPFESSVHVDGMTFQLGIAFTL
jgi:hypothetical protein